MAIKKDQNTAKTIASKYPQAFEGQVLESSYFFFEVAPDSREDLEIVFGGFEKCAPDFEIKRTTFPYYVIEFPTTGKCEFTINDKEYTLEKNKICCFSPGDSHHYKCDKKRPMEHFFIAFLGQKAEQLIQKTNLKSNPVMNLASFPKSLSLINQIYQLAKDKNLFAQEICCNYLNILLLEQASNIAHSKDVGNPSMGTFLTCKKYIDDNFPEIKTVTQAASSCGIDKRYMARLFKKYINISPHEYVMRLKLNQAGSLLLTTNMSVKEIAYKMGFDDQYHFSRNFKKFHNLSPQHYRNAHI